MTPQEMTITEQIVADITFGLHHLPAHSWKEETARRILRHIVERLERPARTEDPAHEEEGAA